MQNSFEIMVPSRSMYPVLESLPYSHNTDIICVEIYQIAVSGELKTKGVIKRTRSIASRIRVRDRESVCHRDAINALSAIALSRLRKSRRTPSEC